MHIANGFYDTNLVNYLITISKFLASLTKQNEFYCQTVS